MFLNSEIETSRNNLEDICRTTGSDLPLLGRQWEENSLYIYVTRNRKNSHVIQAENFLSFCTPSIQSLRGPSDRYREENMEV